MVPNPTSQSEEPAGGTREALDREHDNDARGEHRYPDAGQTAAERAARAERDNLKRRLEAKRSGPIVAR